MMRRWQGSSLAFVAAASFVMSPLSVGSAQGKPASEPDAPQFWLASASRGKPALTPLVVERMPVLGRRITLRLKNVTLKEALAGIVAQSDLRLGYSDDVLPAARRVDLSANRITVVAALTDVLFGTGLDVIFTKEGKASLARRAPAVSAGGVGAIVGQVVDSATHHPLAGADVSLDGTRWRTMTDSAGRYRLAEVDSGAYKLMARRLGYAKRSRSVVVRVGGEDTVNLALPAVAARLDELVTTATGQQRRRDIGNAITTINADSVLQHAPIRNLTDLLANRVPGLTVQHTSGAPGDPAKLRLRGLGSALRSNDPVVVVDGVRLYAAQSAARSGNLTNLAPSSGSGVSVWPNSKPVADAPAPSPLDQIDPNTIEKIEVFKGPSAATLYGADAANGVIVITTKKGRPGPTRWNATVARSRTASLGTYPTGYFPWGHQLVDGLPVFCPLSDNSCRQDSVVRYQALNDPAFTVLGQGARTDLSLTASGGTQALTYSITGTYGDELGGLRLPDYEVARFRTRFNQDAPDWMRRPHQYTNWDVGSSVTARLSPTADVTLTTKLTRSEQQRTSLEDQLGALAGTYIDTVNKLYYLPGNTLNQSEYFLDTTSVILNNYYIKRTASAITFTTGLNANWRPRSWFTAIGQAGLDVTPRRDQLLVPSGLLAPTDSGAASLATGRSLVSTFNLQGTLQKPLKWGFNFQTSIGANLTTTTTSDLSTAAGGLLPGTSTISGAARILAAEQGSNTSVYGWYLEPRLAGQRLSISTGLRLDGGSAYGTRFTRSGLGFGLPKLNASWVVSEEPWFPLRSLFSSLRLRGAYGQAQVQPGPADRLRIYQGSLSIDSTLALTNLGNSQLRPERSTEFEAGFDADVLDNRVTLELTRYRKLQVDALMATTLAPSVHGGGTVLQNIGNIRNAGLELTLGLTAVRSPALTWGTQLLYSTNDNVVTKLGRGVAPNPQQGLVAGYPLGGRWALPILGFADANGDGVLQRDEIQLGDSLVFMGRLQPNRQLGLSTNLALFNGALGLTAGFSYATGAIQIDQTARTNWVLARALVDATTPLSEQAALLASTIGTGGYGMEITDYGLMQDVSTFRFNNVSLNYRVPAALTHRLGAQQLSVALQGDNLALHSTYKGKDPDVNSWSPGENIQDTGQLPQPRTWRLAVYLQY